jgi:hypothetical protein
MTYLLLYIDEEERFKGPKGTNPLWTLFATNYQGQIPWTYSGQGIDLEKHSWKCDKAYWAFRTCMGMFEKLVDLHWV